MQQPRNNNRITHNSNRILDHIIPVRNDISLSVSVDYINLDNVSDHYPVHGEIAY